MVTRGAIYVDFDGTLAHYDKWEGPTALGKPIGAMCDRVLKWLDEGYVVKVFTARVWADDSLERQLQAQMAHDAIMAWCKRHLGVYLPVTCVKAPDGVAFYGDRAFRVEKNTGRVLDGQ